MNADEIVAEARGLEAERDPERRRAAVERLVSALGDEGVSDVIHVYLSGLPHQDIERASTTLMQGMLATGTWARRAWVNAASRAGVCWAVMLRSYGEHLPEAYSRDRCPTCGVESPGPDEDRDYEHILDVYTIREDHGSWLDGGGAVLTLAHCEECGEDHLYAGDTY